MRPALSSLLLLSLVLAAVAQWWPQGSAGLVRAVSRPDGAAASEAASRDGASGHQDQPLPTALVPVGVEPATRNIFASVVPKPAPTPPPPAMVRPPEPALAPLPPPRPIAPAQSLRYLGYMLTPAGETLVLLADGETPVPVQPGTRLPNGYVVQTLGQNAVRLLYPLTDTVVDLPIPPAATQRP